MLKKIKINGLVYYAVCSFKSTRNGFNHYCDLYKNSKYGFRKVADAKACYINRTWERYEYESVINDCIHQVKVSLSKKGA